MNSFTFLPFSNPFAFYFQQPWEPIPTQALWNNSCSSPLSFVLTQKGKPSSSFLGHTPFFFPPSFSTPILLGLTLVLYTFSSIRPWMELFLEPSLEKPPPTTCDVSTSIPTVLLGWVYLESSPLCDVEAPSPYLNPSWYVQPPINQDFTSSSNPTPSHFLTQYSSLLRWRQWSTMSSFILNFKKKLLLLSWHKPNS